MFINILLPPRCIKCGKILSERNGLCPECYAKIEFISEPYCYCCGHPFADSTGVKFATKQICGNCAKEKKHVFIMQRSAFVYDENSKDLVIDFKFHDKTVSAEVLANMLFVAGKDIWAENPDYLIPVPLHKKRLHSRRYNQSALLCKYLSRKSLVAVDYFSLKRTVNTVPQVSLTGTKRRNNLKKAFVLENSEKFKGKSVVLVDDVKTTGSTLRECALVLRRAGVKNIYSLTLAQTD
ncbi:MAG: ComF family protein [Alphaproteobacteria bacterium]|nr:ComF family protein [Alphaproteobacteria bacterium]